MLLRSIQSVPKCDRLIEESPVQSRRLRSEALRSCCTERFPDAGVFPGFLQEPTAVRPRCNGSTRSPRPRPPPKGGRMSIPLRIQEDGKRCFPATPEMQHLLQKQECFRWCTVPPSSEYGS